MGALKLPKMTYYVSSGTLNLAQLNSRKDQQSLDHKCIFYLFRCQGMQLVHAANVVSLLDDQISRILLEPNPILEMSAVFSIVLYYPPSKASSWLAGCDLQSCTRLFNSWII